MNSSEAKNKTTEPETTMTTTQPTRMQEVARLNARIDRLVELRNGTASPSYLKALRYDLERARVERDALELSLYEEYGITVER